MSRVTRYALGALAVVVVLACGGAAWLLEAAAHLTLGWFSHLHYVLPRVTVSGSGIALFAMALPATAWLAHSTCRWLWEDGEATDARPPRTSEQWRWKWTLIGLAVVMLMFVAGVAATGVVHQTGWLIRSPAPLLEMRHRPLVLQVKCRSNLRQIGLAVLMYVHDGGHWPTSRAELARMATVLDVTPDMFVCPASAHERAPGTQPAEWSAAIDDDRYFSYVVSPRPLSPPDSVGRVMMYEPLDQHSDGMNLLYDDGHVEWLDRPVAEQWLATIDSESKAGPATTRQAD